MYLNIWAILAGAIAYMIIGMIWYSPSVFGRRWARLTGLKKSQLKSTWASYFIAMLAALVTSFVMAKFIDWFQIDSARQGAIMGIWIWAGFVATVLINTVLWEKKKFSLYLINSMHYLLSLVVMGAILAKWL